MDFNKDFSSHVSMLVNQEIMRIIGNINFHMSDARTKLLNNELDPSVLNKAYGEIHDALWPTVECTIYSPDKKNEDKKEKKTITELFNIFEGYTRLLNNPPSTRKPMISDKELYEKALDALSEMNMSIRRKLQQFKFFFRKEIGPSKDDF